MSKRKPRPQADAPPVPTDKVPVRIGSYLVFHRGDPSSFLSIFGGERFYGPFDTWADANDKARNLVGGRSLIVKVEGQYETIRRAEPNMEVSW